jgi:type III secretory pathway lipoprotein EscJ
VHLALPPEDPLAPGSGPRLRPTASVLLKSRGKLAVGDAEVKRLVAGAVHDLQTTDVSVVIAPVGESPAAPARVRESRGAMATLAAAGLGGVLLLGALLVFAATRISSLRRRLRDLERT